MPPVINDHFTVLVHSTGEQCLLNKATTSPGFLLKVGITLGYLKERPTSWKNRQYRSDWMKLWGVIITRTEPFVWKNNLHTLGSWEGAYTLLVDLLGVLHGDSVTNANTKPSFHFPFASLLINRPMVCSTVKRVLRRYKQPVIAMKVVNTNLKTVCHRFVSNYYWII